MGLKKDKIEHALGSFLGVLIGYKFLKSIGLAGIIIFLIGLGKELWDLAGNGVASWEDIGANIIGIIAAVTFIWWLEQRRKETERSAKKKNADAAYVELTLEAE